MNNQARSGGLGVVTILGIVFLILKLCNVIDWNWWLVCLPFIIEGGIIVIVLILNIIISILNNRRL